MVETLRWVECGWVLNFTVWYQRWFRWIGEERKHFPVVWSVASRWAGLMTQMKRAGAIVEGRAAPVECSTPASEDLAASSVIFAHFLFAILLLPCTEDKWHQKVALDSIGFSSVSSGWVRLNSFFDHLKVV